MNAHTHTYICEYSRPCLKLHHGGRFPRFCLLERENQSGETFFDGLINAMNYFGMSEEEERERRIKFDTCFMLI